MAVTYQWDSLRRLLDEGIAEVVRAHWEEIALDKATVPLDTDWDRYLRNEALGTWRVFSARRGGVPIGYICWWIDHHIRYQATIYATADVFFILPAHRNGLVGYRLFSEAFKALPRPCKVLVNEKLHFQDGRVGKLLSRLGMKPIEVVYSKFLAE